MIAEERKVNLKEKIKDIVRSYNSAPTRVLNNKSSFYVMFGTEHKNMFTQLKIPTNTVERNKEIENVNEFRKKIPDLLHENYEKDAVSVNKSRVKEEYYKGNKVLLKNVNKENKLSAQYEGPYVISKKLADLTFEVKKLDEVDAKARKMLVHINGLKKFKERDK